ncbi:MAG: hypothetical protein NZM26_03710, partial [Patescibacteria group bacterium]|nr:hypothetical protein [Patescibacteria group bacterium]
MTERIGVVRELLLREPRSVARNFVLQASGDREHREAGLDDGTVELDLRFGKGLICYGGQDAVGAAVFPLSEENSIQAVMVAADGCSFGDKTNSAKAAKIAVEHNLLGWD